MFGRQVMYKYLFSRMPSWWVNNDSHGFIAKPPNVLQSSFKAGTHTNKSIVSLKCYLTILTAINFESGISIISFTKIEEIAGVSRPMIKGALKHLEDVGLIAIEKIGNRNQYNVILENDDYSQWGKLPRELVKKSLCDMPSRGVKSLNALKIYIYLLANRPNDSQTISITYDDFEKELCISRTNIRGALCILVNLGFISITNSIGTKPWKHNVYKLNGISV